MCSYIEPDWTLLAQQSEAAGADALEFFIRLINNYVDTF
jgi:dihydroorotate dehydrogenase